MITFPAPTRNAVDAIKSFIGDRFSREADHTGATADWHPLDDFRARPVAALTAEPHREIDDPHLGVIRVAGQVPAYMHNALALARNLPSLLDPKDPA